MGVRKNSFVVNSIIICKLCTHLKYLPCDIRKVYQLTGKRFPTVCFVSLTKGHNLMEKKYQFFISPTYEKQERK